MPMPPTIDGLTGRLSVRRDGDLVTIALSGRLDAATGVELLAAVQTALEGGASRIDVDLLGMDSYAPEGARALPRCRSLAQTLAGGLHFRFTTGVGHDAIAEAFADEADVTGEVPAVDGAA